MTKVSTYKGNFAIHPGETVAELMKFKNWNDYELSQKIGVDKDIITKLVNGKIDIDASLAIKLGNIFGIRDTFFVTLQIIYSTYLKERK